MTYLQYKLRFKAISELVYLTYREQRKTGAPDAEVDAMIKKLKQQQLKLEEQFMDNNKTGSVT